MNNYANSKLLYYHRFWLDAVYDDSKRVILSPGYFLYIYTNEKTDFLQNEKSRGEKK